MVNPTAAKRFGLRAAFVAASLACLIGTLHAQQPVSWTNYRNVAVRGSSLEKTGGCQGCDDAGAVSQQMIQSGDGFVEFMVGENNSFWMAGLGRRNGNANFANIDFGVRLNGNGRADVVENGQYAGGDTEYRANDVFRIEVVNGVVRYLKNGQLIHVSQRQPSYPLVLDVALGSIGSSIRNARIETRASGAATLTWLEDFDSLDRNGDRIVSRAEWRGTRRNFNLRDLDRDGVLSRYEFRGSVDDFPGARREAVGTAGQFISVNPTNRWTDTGIFVEAGDAITFEADGSVQLSGSFTDTATPAGSRRSARGAPLFQATAGSLIARIGNSAPFLIGANRRMARAPMSGPLFLGVNDDHLADNRGEYRVFVTVEPR